MEVSYNNGDNYGVKVIKLILIKLILTFNRDAY